MNTDVPVALLEIARRRLSLRDYLQSLRKPIEPAVFALDDPVPALLEMPALIYLYFKRLMRRRDA